MKKYNLQMAENYLMDWEKQVEQVRSDRKEATVLKELYTEKEEILLHIEDWYCKGMRELRIVLLEKEITEERERYFSNIEKILDSLFELLVELKEDLQE